MANLEKITKPWEVKEINQYKLCTLGSEKMFMVYQVTFWYEWNEWRDQDEYEDSFEIAGYTKTQQEAERLAKALNAMHHLNSLMEHLK